jgi:hypothetical protein
MPRTTLTEESRVGVEERSGFAVPIYLKVIIKNLKRPRKRWTNKGGFIVEILV